MYYKYADIKLENTNMSFPRIMTHNHRGCVMGIYAAVTYKRHTANENGWF